MSRWHREHPEAALADLLASPSGFPPGTRHLPAPGAPTLLDAAAERCALASGRPVSQERAEIVAPHPEPAADGLFAPRD